MSFKIEYTEVVILTMPCCSASGGNGIIRFRISSLDIPGINPLAEVLMLSM